MNKQLLKGNRVTILSTKYSKLEYGLNNDMKDMVGGIYKVENDYTDGCAVIIKGHHWHIKDLEIIPGIKSPKMINSKESLFDVALLDL